MKRRLAGEREILVIRFVVTNGEQVEHDVGYGECELVRSELPVNLFVTAPVGSGVTLAGARLPVLRLGGSVTAACRVDGARTIGAVRVEARPRNLPPARLDILIARAEEALDEFLRAARLIEVGLPRLRGGFTYVDSTGARVRFLDPVRVATFIVDNAPAIRATVRSVDREPATRRITLQSTRPPSANVNVPATRTFLAAHPDFLQRSAASILTVDGIGYAPMLVRTDRQISTVDTEENRRIARFIARLCRDARTAERSGALPPDVADDLRRDRLGIQELMATTVFGKLPGPENEDAVLEPTVVERADRRYVDLRRVRVRYLTDVVPNVNSDQFDRQHLARPDEVYQSLCVVLVAAAFDLSPYTTADGVAAYRNDVWELLSNTATSIRSWRNQTLRPDDFRPDLVLRRRAAPARCILVDAKYSQDALAGPGSDQVKEVQAYMNAFGLSRAGILYPGPVERVLSMDWRDIAGHGFLLREIPLRAVEPHQLPEVLTALRTRLIELEDEAQFGVPA